MTNQSTAKFLYYLLILLTISGIFTSAYLAHSHYRNFTDLAYQSFCAISPAINCDTVAQSPYSIIFNLPVAAWGTFCYIISLIILLYRRPTKNRYITTAILLSYMAICSIASIGLALISIFAIHSYCLMCIALYAINLATLYLLWLCNQRSNENFISILKKEIILINTNRKTVIFTSLLLAASFALIYNNYPKYWAFDKINQKINIKTGVTLDGDPWIGAENPKITIIEYTDYLCFQCAKMHNHLRNLINIYPDKLRLVHRHFPLDSKFNPFVTNNIHPNSGLFSIFTIIAQKQDIFWQANDSLFYAARTEKSVNLNEIATKLGLDISEITTNNIKENTKIKLLQDITSGVKLNITSTPSYNIDGVIYQQTIPNGILDKISGKLKLYSEN